MKIRIEVELTADEAPKVTQLLDVLRQISDHVSVSAPISGISGNVSAPVVPIIPQAAPISNDLEGKFMSILLRMQTEAQMNHIARDITEVFAEITAVSQNADEAVRKALNDLCQAFYALIFEPDKGHFVRSLPVSTYVFLLGAIPNKFGKPLSDLLVPRMLKFLTIKRPIAAAREEFFAHAEAFAALVKQKLVWVTGAVSILITLLGRPDTRLVAITMLGKTVELCHDILLAECDAAKLKELEDTLATVDEEVFKYDVTYVKDHLFVRAVTPLTTDTSLKSVTLSPVLRYSRTHDGTVFALAMDSKRNELISSSKDGSLMVWDINGNVRERILLSKFYACSMDISLTGVHGALFVCGVAITDINTTNSPPPPSILLYRRGGEPKGWENGGVLGKHGAKLISTVRSIKIDSGPELFVTGECMSDDKQLVNIYDANSSSFSKLKPITSFAEHKMIITRLARYPGSDTMFFSGSRDSTVLMWDRRQKKSVHRLSDHSGMITCLDTAENVLVSVGIDKQLVCWDIRTIGESQSKAMSKQTVDNSAILKAALGPFPSSTAAVSTLKGLYSVTLDASKPAVKSLDFPGGKSHGKYHDLAWSPTFDTLFAAGDEFVVDKYSVNLY